MRWAFVPDAQLEFDGAVDWFDEQRSGLGHEFASEVELTIERILQNPEGHPFHHFDDEVRYRKTNRFRYAILFVVESDLVRVVAVAHTSREPGYWKGRLD